MPCHTAWARLALGPELKGMFWCEYSDAAPGGLTPAQFVVTQMQSDFIFLKDLGIFRMTLIPCASHLIYRHSGVPRNLVLRPRPADAARALARKPQPAGSLPCLRCP